MEAWLLKTGDSFGDSLSVGAFEHKAHAGIQRPASFRESPRKRVRSVRRPQSRFKALISLAFDDCEQGNF
jgi:hypothetical protein